MDINVEKIMEEIRADIKDQGLSEEELDFYRKPILRTDYRAAEEKSMESAMEEEVDFARMLADMNAERILQSGGRSFFQKVTRKIFKFLGIPTGAEQTQYNVAICQCVQQLAQLVIQQQKSIDFYESEMEHLRRRVDRIAERQESNT